MNLIKKLISAALNEGYLRDVTDKAEQIEAARFLTCSTCPKNHEGKCLVCGCFLEVKVPMNYNKNMKKSLRVEKTHCPLGKWQGYDDVTGEIYANDKDIANHYRTIDNIKKLT